MWNVEYKDNKTGASIERRASYALMYTCAYLLVCFHPPVRSGDSFPCHHRSRPSAVRFPRKAVRDAARQSRSLRKGLLAGPGSGDGSRPAGDQGQSPFPPFLGSTPTSSSSRVANLTLSDIFAGYSLSDSFKARIYGTGGGGGGNGVSQMRSVYGPQP